MCALIRRSVTLRPIGENAALDASADFVGDLIGGVRWVPEDVTLCDRCATELVVHLAGRWLVGEAMTLSR